MLREVRAARRRSRNFSSIVRVPVVRVPGDDRREVRVQLPHRLRVGEAPGAHQRLAKRRVQRAVVLGVDEPLRDLARRRA